MSGLNDREQAQLKAYFELSDSEMVIFYSALMKVLYSED